MRRYLLLALCALLLTACQTQERGKAETIAWLQRRGMSASEANYVANNKPLLRQYLNDVAMSAPDDQYCRSLGAVPGTQAYVQCRSLRSASRPVQPDKPKPLNCEIRLVNNMVRTTCE